MGGKKEEQWQHRSAVQKYLPITSVTEWRLQARWVPVILHWCHCVGIDYVKPLKVQGWPDCHSVQMAGRWTWSIARPSRRQTLRFIPTPRTPSEESWGTILCERTCVASPYITSNNTTISAKMTTKSSDVPYPITIGKTLNAKPELQRFPAEEKLSRIIC